MYLGVFEDAELESAVHFPQNLIVSRLPIGIQLQRKQTKTSIYSGKQRDNDF